MHLLSACMARMSDQSPSSSNTLPSHATETNRCVDSVVSRRLMQRLEGRDQPCFLFRLALQTAHALSTPPLAFTCFTQRSSFAGLLDICVNGSISSKLSNRFFCNGIPAVRVWLVS